MMEMVLSNEFFDLSEDEMSMLDGGVDLEAVGNGFAIAATAIATVACAPASAFVGASFVGMYIAGVVSGVAAGCYLSYGLIIK